MQPDNVPNQDWRPPTEQSPQTPFQSVYSQDLADVKVSSEPHTEDVSPNRATETTTVPAPRQPVASQINDVTSEEQLADNEADQEREDAILTWQAHESIEQSRPVGWYVIFIIVAIALLGLSIFVFKSLTFSLLIPVMAVAIFLYTRHEPEIISYTVSRKGVHVNDQLYGYDMFRSFNITRYKQRNWLTLVPRKRFAMPVTAYFPEEVGEPLVDMLAARLPMKESKPDPLEKLVSLLRL